MISQQELDRLGLPHNSLKVTDPKTGKEGYRAAVEVFHQLHCLNLLRQAIYKDYYKDIYSDIQEEEEGLKGHVGMFSAAATTHKLVPDITIHLANRHCRSLPRGYPHQPDVHLGHWYLHVP